MQGNPDFPLNSKMFAGVTGGCVRTLEPIRGCPSVRKLQKVLMQRCSKARAVIRERASGMARTPGALASPSAWRQLP
jgi:hypothetical protein